MASISQPEISEERLPGLDREYIQQQLRKIELLRHLIQNSVSNQSRWSHFSIAMEPHMTLKREGLRSSQRRLSDEIDQHIIESTATDCLSLCCSIQASLPLELRIMIYRHILPPSYVLIEDTDFLPATATASSQRYLLEAQQLLNPLCCGDMMRYELLTSWYEYSTFQFASPDLVAKFLDTDLWGYDLPVRKFVTRLEIELLPINKADHGLCFSRIKDFECLSSLKKRATIICPIDTDQYRSRMGFLPSQQEGEFRRILKHILPLLRQLIDAGHQVVLEVDGEEEPPLAHTWQLTEDSWQEKIDEYCSQY